jgi:hypothetical protein
MIHSLYPVAQGKPPYQDSPTWNPSLSPSIK